MHVLRFITHTPKIRNKVADTNGVMPTRGRALPFVATSLRHIGLGKEVGKQPLAVVQRKGQPHRRFRPA